MVGLAILSSHSESRARSTGVSLAPDSGSTALRATVRCATLLSPSFDFSPGSSAMIATNIASRVSVPTYSASKAAPTMLTVQYAEMLPGMRVNAADPGYTMTDFSTATTAPIP